LSIRDTPYSASEAVLTLAVKNTQDALKVYVRRRSRRQFDLARYGDLYRSKRLMCKRAFVLVWSLEYLGETEG
jgi:hypothetical protein